MQRFLKKRLSVGLVVGRGRVVSVLCIYDICVLSLDGSESAQFYDSRVATTI